MNCDEASGHLADQLKGLLNARDQRAVDQHLQSCPACKEEAAAIAMLWNGLSDSEVAIPDERMRTRFHAALAAYEERIRSNGASRFAEWFLPARMALQASAAVALLVAGGFIGRSLSDSTEEIDGLRQEVRAMSIAMLDHQSASERLLGVEWSARDASHSQVTSALLDVVRNDQNVNVRLAAVEVLSEWADRPEVASGLLAALSMEEAPLLQVTLIELLLKRNANDTIAVARQLLDTESLDPIVREFVRTRLNAIENGTAPETA